MSRFILALLALAGPAGCADLCGNRILHRVASPDGRHMAILFERDCGATTAASYQVSILPAGETPSGRGNVFIAEPGRASADRPNEPVVEVAWLSPHRLQVRYRHDDRLFERVDQREGVQVEYVRGDP